MNDSQAHSQAHAPPPVHVPFRVVERVVPSADPVVCPASPVPALASIGALGAPAMHPEVDAVQERTIEWAYRFMLIVDDETSTLLRRVRFVELAAGSCSRAPARDLALLNDWITWLFFHDDWFCDGVGSSVARDPTRLAALHKRLLEILAGARPDSDEGPLSHALSDLRYRLARRMGGGWLPRFTRGVRAYFQSNLWEIQTRNAGRAPSIPAYLKMRAYSGAVHTAFDFLDVTAGGMIPAELREHAVLQQLALMANNCICWVNDIFSYPKEIQEGHATNLVLLLQRERGLAVDDAVARAVELHNEELRAFLELERELPRFSHKLSPAALAYVEGMRAWMFGNLAWSRETARYQQCVNMKNWAEDP